jgi:hypothetical protein
VTDGHVSQLGSKNGIVSEFPNNTDSQKKSDLKPPKKKCEAREHQLASHT